MFLQWRYASVMASQATDSCLGLFVQDNKEEISRIDITNIEKGP